MTPKHLKANVSIKHPRPLQSKYFISNRLAEMHVRTWEYVFDKKNYIAKMTLHLRWFTTDRGQHIILRIIQNSAG